MSPYRIACLGALVCTVVAWIEWGPWGGIAVAAPCAILLLIALPSALGAADDVGSTELSVGCLTIGVSRWDGTHFLHDPDPEWPDWIDAEGEPMPRVRHTADLNKEIAELRKKIEATRPGRVGVCYLDTEPYHAPSPKEDATCRNLSAGSPVSSA